MIKLIAIFCLVVVGGYAANRLDEKSQRKIAVVVAALFAMLVLLMVVKELMH